MEFLILVFVVVIGFLAILAYSSLSWGFVMFKFYHWFLMSVFIDLPPITFTQAIGLAIFTSLLKNHTQTSIKKEYQDTSNNTIMLIISPWVTFLFGWIIYEFIK